MWDLYCTVRLSSHPLKLLLSILGSGLDFFDQHPVGRVLNRFASDVAAVDEQIPFITNIFLAQLFGTGLLCIHIYAKGCLVFSVVLHALFTQDSWALRLFFSSRLPCCWCFSCRSLPCTLTSSTPTAECLGICGG